MNIEKEIESITRQIMEKYKPSKIILFGSVVQGKFTPDSDLDFLIIKKNTPYLGRERARELRKLINKQWAADFLIYRPEEFDIRRRLGDPFIKEIIAHGKVLYDRERDSKRNVLSFSTSGREIS
jgi:predicted nucleotidyltransferase